VPSPLAPSTQIHHASPPQKNSSLGTTALDPSSISFMLGISSVGRSKIPPGNGPGRFLVWCLIIYRVTSLSVPFSRFGFHVKYYFELRGGQEERSRSALFLSFPPIPIASRLVIVPFHRQFLHSLNVCTFPIPIDHSAHDDNGIFSHSKSSFPVPVHCKISLTFPFFPRNLPGK